MLYFILIVISHNTEIGSIMLKGAIYLNTFIFLVLSIFFLGQLFRKSAATQKLRLPLVITLILDIINATFYFNDIIEVDWDIIYLFPISALAAILCIIGIIRTNKLGKAQTDKTTTKLNLTLYTLLAIVPALLAIVPFAYESYLLYNCEYLLKFNYQNGIIQSDDTYIAIINHKPTTITLQLNRKGKTTDKQYYEVSYVDGTKVTTRDSKFNKVLAENNNLEKIAADAKKKAPSAQGGSIYYFPEGKYVIIHVTSDEGSGLVLGEYFYYNNNYVSDIDTHGTLETVTYYGK